MCFSGRALDASKLKSSEDLFTEALDTALHNTLWVLRRCAELGSRRVSKEERQSHNPVSEEVPGKTRTPQPLFKTFVTKSYPPIPAGYRPVDSTDTVKMGSADKALSLRLGIFVLVFRFRRWRDQPEADHASEWRPIMHQMLCSCGF